MTRLGALVALAAALGGAAACGSSTPTTPTNTNTGPIVFVAQLSAANEVPPIANAEANARGQATITMNVTRDPATGAVTGGGTVSFSAQLTNFPNGSTATLAHIHRGVAGVAGGVEINTGLSAANPVSLASGSGTITVNDVAISQSLATELATNPAGFYFNVHSPVNPGGVVRGQLTRQ